jgi:hypothetical protein
MTVSSTSTSVSYSGNGATTAFAVTFPFYELTAYLTTASVEAQLTEDTHYTLSGGDGSTGTLTMLTAPASGTTLRIKRTTSRLQETDYAENDAFPAEAHEKAIDRAYMMIQEMDAALADEVLEFSEIADSDDVPEGAVNLFLTVAERAKLGLVISVKDAAFGAVGDGVEDDSAALQDAFDYIAANGGALRIPAGTYNIETALTIGTAAMPFHIYGDGKEITKIVRAAAIGTPLTIHTTDWWQLSDLTIDGGFAAFPTSANHGFAFYDSNHARIRRVHVVDYNNTGILGYTSVVDDPPTHTDCWAEDCSTDGLGVSNNGMLFANLSYSGFLRCDGLDVGKSGSPCYAVQLKNGCQHSGIVDCTAEGGLIGFALGNNGESGDDRNFGNSIVGGRAVNCTVGIGLGDSHGGHISGVHIDMSATGNYGIDFGGSSTGWNVSGVSVHNLASGVSKFAVILRSGDTDNNVDIGIVSKPGASNDVLVSMLSGALRNTVRIGRVSNPTTYSSETVLVSNAGGSTNTFEYGALPQIQTSTIASGIITLRDNKVRLVRMDTEASAASDDLDSIANGVDGQIITIFSRLDARDVVVKDATNIRLNGAGDLTLGNSRSSVTLMYNGLVSAWVELCRSEAT